MPLPMRNGTTNLSPNMPSPASRRGRSGLWVMPCLFAILMFSSHSSAQEFIAQPAAAAARAVHEANVRPPADQIIARMIERNGVRNELLRNYSALREYEIRDLDDRLLARTVVRVDYRAPGSKSFQKISEDGSWIARRLVFDRLLQAEEQTASGQEHRESSISEENYSFRIAGEENLGARHCFVIEAQPKREDNHLFVGKIWIDSQDFGIAKISGRPATKLSLWITGARFERDYQRIDGFWLPHHDETVVNVKAHGTKVFRIEHKQYVVNDLASPETALSQAN